MAEGASAASGKQLAGDLRAIREERGLTVDHLHEESKIPRSLIESFEETALFDHPMFNRVYLRSFMRTYAEWIAIAPEMALEALDEALEAGYAGRLRKVYLEGEPSKAAALPTGEEDAAPAPAEETGAPEERPAGEKAEEEGAGSRASSAGAAAGAAAGASEAVRGQMPSEPASTRPFERQEAAARAETSAGEPAWAAQSPPGGASLRRSRPTRRAASTSGTSTSHTMTWIALGAGVLVIGAIVFLVLDLPDGVDIASPQVQPAADTSTASEEAGPPPAADVQLGRMIDLAILAVEEEGGVQSLRLTRDSDLRRPYWIESGQVMVFPAEERIMIENPLDGRNEFGDLRLFVEGYAYPKDRRDDQGRIVMTREMAEDFLQTVTGPPTRFTATPDTNRIPLPQ